ncbi:MAG: integrin alpha, partial [Anaerolineae bacterium]|nr:integrin alpha [Anaerolineae bacterium]
MKAKLLFVVVIFSLVFGSYPVSVGQAMQAAPQSEPTTEPQSTEVDPGPNGVTEEDRVPDELADVPGATDDWWSTVQGQIQRDMYRVSLDVAEDGTPVHHGRSLAHNFDISFSAGGVSLAARQPSRAADLDYSLNGVLAANPQPPAADQGPRWEWGLRLTGYGYKQNVETVPAPVEAVATDNRLTYYREGLVEWYVNDERGLEQGFTLDGPPTSAGDGALVLEMALTTDLTPMLVDEGQTVAFVLSGGNVIALRYADLYVNDATGRQLQSHFILGRDSISIEIDGADAVYPITVDPLATTTPTWTAQGEDTSFGQTVSTAGDVNGDGFADVVIGAWSYTNLSTAGKAFVYHGSAAGLSMTPDWEVDGENPSDSFGFAAGTAGDVNGDGYDDLIVGARGFNSLTGKAYVYLGSPTGLSTTATWTGMGEATGHWYGRAVGAAGDVDGDGFDDIIIGAPRYGSDAGKAYVYGGSSAGLSTSPVWSAAGVLAWPRWDYWGWDVGTAGDVNGDGYDDVIVSGYLHEFYTGKAGVYLGSAAGLSATTDWSATGENLDDRFGYAAGTAGDVNGDGYDDILVGAYAHNGNTGKVYVYLGTGAGLLSAPSWTATGENAGDTFGIVLSTAGDAYGGDGFDEILIGAPGYDGDVGKAYVYGGSADGLSNTPVWTATTEPMVERFGRDVGAAGDVNGDGF